jgi:hypothetical protein
MSLPMGSLQPGVMVVLALLTMASATLLSVAFVYDADWSNRDFDFQDTRLEYDENCSLPCTLCDGRRLPNNSWIDWYVYFLKRNFRRVESWIGNVVWE